VILGVTYYVAKFAAGLLARLLAAVGFDSLPDGSDSQTCFAGGMQPSRLVALLVLIVAMLFATAEAANRLDFTQVRDLVALFIRSGPTCFSAPSSSSSDPGWPTWLTMPSSARMRGTRKALPAIARVAILGLVIAMGLRAMGVADDIVNLAFLLTFGAVAVAVALSFGLGGARPPEGRWSTGFRSCARTVEPRGERVQHDRSSQCA
jgi:hypothetical protein